MSSLFGGHQTLSSSGRERPRNEPQCHAKWHQRRGLNGFPQRSSLGAPRRQYFGAQLPPLHAVITPSAAPQLLGGVSPDSTYPATSEHPLHPLRMQNQVQREGFVEFSTDIMEGVAVLLRTAAYLQRSNSVSTVSLGLDGLFGWCASVLRLCA